MPSGTKAACALIVQNQLAYVQKKKYIFVHNHGLNIVGNSCGTKLLLFVLYFFWSSGEQYLL